MFLRISLPLSSCKFNTIFIKFSNLFRHVRFHFLPIFHFSIFNLFLPHLLSNLESTKFLCLLRSKHSKTLTWNGMTIFVPTGNLKYSLVMQLFLRATARCRQVKKAALGNHLPCQWRARTCTLPCCPAREEGCTGPTTYARSGSRRTRGRRWGGWRWAAPCNTFSGTQRSPSTPCTTETQQRMRMRMCFAVLLKVDLLCLAEIPKESR